MATFIASLLISLDGRNANDLGVPDDEEHEEFNRLFAACDRIVFDREDYELLVPFWDHLDLTDPDVPEVGRDFAEIFRTKPRLVIAPDLTEVDERSERVLGDPVVRLADLKQREEGVVLVSAGADLLTTLLAHQLIDELHVAMRPVLIGGDDSPVTGLVATTPLTLLESRQLLSGTLVLRYRVQHPAA